MADSKRAEWWPLRKAVMASMAVTDAKAYTHDEYDEAMRLVDEAVNAERRLEETREELRRWEGFARGKGMFSAQTGDERSPECVARWPECESGAYDPRCCRFPKSCSCSRAQTEGEGVSDHELLWNMRTIVAGLLIFDVVLVFGFAWLAGRLAELERDPQEKV